MAHTFTDVQRKELKDAFDVFDKDGSGKISSQELGNVLNALNIQVDKQQLNDIMKIMDTNRSGQIEFEEFYRIMVVTYYKKFSRDELRAAFHQFDQDGSGYIQAEELESIMRKMGRPLSKEQINAMIQALDKSGDGKIGFDEFVQLF